MKIQQGVLNKSWRMLSAGTQLEILEDTNKPWEKRGDTISHGYLRVRLRCKPSAQLHQNGFPGGSFDIEADYVTIRRNFTDEVPAVPRERRPDRIAARAVYEIRKNVGSSQ